MRISSFSSARALFFVGALLVGCSGKSLPPPSEGPPVAALDLDAGGAMCAPAPTSPDMSPCGSETCTSLPPTCPTSCTTLGTVKFHLSVPSASAYVVSTYSWAADSVNWFSVSSAAGNALQIVPPTADIGQALYWAPSCSAGASLDVVPLFGQQSVGASGMDGIWNGTAYSTTSTCTQAQYGAVPCGDVLCAPAGKYVVKMCASTSDPNAPPQCVSVPFDFPGTPVVEGTVSSSAFGARGTRSPAQCHPSGCVRARAVLRSPRLRASGSRHLPERREVVREHVVSFFVVGLDRDVGGHTGRIREQLRARHLRQHRCVLSDERAHLQRKQLSRRDERASPRRVRERGARRGRDLPEKDLCNQERGGRNGHASHDRLRERLLLRAGLLDLYPAARRGGPLPANRHGTVQRVVLWRRHLRLEPARQRGDVRRLRRMPHLSSFSVPELGQSTMGEGS